MKRPGPFAAVLFDMDGLLLDSERLALAVLAQCAGDCGLSWRPEIGLAMVGRNIRDADAVLRGHFGEDPRLEALRHAFRERYDGHIDAHGVALKRGAAELLDWLAARDIPRAVATSTARERAARKLARTGLLERFQVVVCGDEVAQGKPAPDIFLAAAARLRAEPAACLVLEDSNAGARAGLAAGMQVVMIPDMLAPDPELTEQVSVAESLLQVLGWLEAQAPHRG